MPGSCPGERAPSEAGWDETAARAGLTAGNPALAYLMPDFHNPTGRSMSAEQRERILAAAAAAGHESSSPTRPPRNSTSIGRRALPAARRVRSTRCSSARSARPCGAALRIGWIRAERPLIRKLVAARAAGDLGTPDPRAAHRDATCCARLARVLEQRRASARAPDASPLEPPLAEPFPEWTVPHVHGGLATWVGLGAPVSSQLALAARDHGLLIAAGPRFGIDGAFERFLRIPISYSADETERAVDAPSPSPGRRLGSHPVPDCPDLAASPTWSEASLRGGLRGALGLAHLGQRVRVDDVGDGAVRAVLAVRLRRPRAIRRPV